MNEGPMTGRQMGRCATGSDRLAPNTDPTWGTPGYGRSGFMGGQRCRGFRWRAVMAETAPVQDDQENIATGKVLSQIERLEKEIEALKDQVQQDSNS